MGAPEHRCLGDKKGMKGSQFVLKKFAPFILSDSLIE